MKKIIFMFLFACPAFAGTTNGLNTVVSKHSFEKTIGKLEVLLKKKGMTIFAKIDHAKNAKKAGMTLEPNVVVIFGNPKIGSPIMKESASFGIDLPVKMQITQQNKIVRITYNDPLYLAARHGTKADLPQIRKMAGALMQIAKKVGE